MKSNYYSVIPATVRYDKELKASEKLLYGEITALANKNGYCWAGNSYFAELYGVHKTTVSKWISNLEKKDYIKVVLEYVENTKQIEKRCIYINDTPIGENAKGYRQKDQEGISEKTNTPIGENAKDNNTSINNTSINNIYIPEKSEKELRREIFDHYLSLKLIKHHKYTPAMDLAIKTAMKNNGYTIEDCKALLDRHKKAVEATKGSEYSIRARPLHEFFGQKAYQAKHLICADYEEGGKYYDLQRPRRKQGPKKQMDFNQFPQHEYTEDELDSLFEKIEVEEMDYD